MFDYDGVLADTMGEMFEAWRYSFLHNKIIEILRQNFFLMEGYPARKIAEELCDKYNVDKKHIEKIIKDKENYYLENNKFKLNKGINDIINLLKKEKKLIAIVSGAPKIRIKKMIGEELFNKFDLIVSAGDTERGKPYPDPYEKALNVFNILPGEAIVVENAPLGIKSAKAAGIYCIAIESTLDKSYLKGADIIVKDIKNLLLFLNRVM